MELLYLLLRRQYQRFIGHRPSVMGPKLILTCASSQSKHLDFVNERGFAAAAAAAAAEAAPARCHKSQSHSKLLSIPKFR